MLRTDQMAPNLTGTVFSLIDRLTNEIYRQQVIIDDCCTD